MFKFYKIKEPKEEGLLHLCKMSVDLPKKSLKKIYLGNHNKYTVETPVVTQATDLDGTYGKNAQGIFWFTPDGVYQEWNGLYFYSSERMSFTTKPLLIESTDGK